MLYDVLMVTSPCDEPEGTSFSGRAKPLPPNKTIRDIFGGDMTLKIRFRATPVVSFKTVFFIRFSKYFMLCETSEKAMPKQR